VNTKDPVQKPLTADECEWGRKEIKHGVLELAWTHIADTEGNVRRGLASIQRFDFDSGTWDPNITALVQGLYPTKPFGYGFYYSKSIEQTVELSAGLNHGDQYNSYLSPYLFGTYKYNDQAAVNFLVSDAAFPALSQTLAKPGASKPAAWIVPQGNLLPTAEYKELTAIAPVLTTDAQIIAFNASGKAPLSYSENASGMGFYDQNDRLIVTATNLVWSGNNVTIHLTGLPASGTWHVTELQTEVGQTGLLSRTIEVVDGKATIELPLGRYDTRVLALTH
jgi:hypothetical protein